MYKRAIPVFLFVLAVISATLTTTQITAATHTTPLYIALGDSFAAGDGLNLHPTSNCRQSDAAYPHLVASALHYRLIDLACSGASFTSGLEGALGDDSPQLQQLFKNDTPSLITMSIGANDIQWLTAFQECYQIHCSASSLPTDVSSHEAVLFSNIQAILDIFSRHYGKKTPSVLFTGYFSAYAPTENCFDTQGENPTSLATSTSAVINNLNTTIQSAIEPYSFAKFVPVDFTGHELCSSDPWTQGIEDKAPLHPNMAGQQAYATAVEAAEAPKPTESHHVLSLPNSL